MDKNKKAKFTSFISNAGKSAKDLLDSAVQGIDQNDDGKFDLSDVSVLAGAVGGAVKKTTQSVLDSAGETARAMELRKLQPIFADSLTAVDFLMPKLVRIVERDKRYAESEVCKGSIGYCSDQKDLHMVNIFLDSVDAFGLTFYPESDCDFYYVDPSDKEHYIAINDYFSFLKIARINELQKIAQDLGAKHFRVIYKEEETSFSEKKAKGTAKASIANADLEQHSAESKYSMVEVAAEMSFPGHAPVRPQLRYLLRDPSIQNLVAMRMDETAPLLHQRLVLKLSNSSGLKESDAAKIDAVLKGAKVTGSITIAAEARNESKRYLEYDITF